MSKHVGRRRMRVVCPVCHEQTPARWSPYGELELIVERHPARTSHLVVLGATPRECLGGGRRVGQEAMPPRPRPISYEETLRAIATLLGESGAA